jgi:tRNA pseudouridine55 synthase
MVPYGLLNLDKPPGLTSRQAVDRVERLARPAKAGHAGTLDPLATGVLVVCVGPATHLIQYVQRMPKTYTGTFLLGRRSPTEDVEGEVTELPGPPIPSLDQIVAAARSFCGRIEQRPPAYSALKVGGRRAYDLARAGQHVDLAPRSVNIRRIEVQAYDYPRLTLEVECDSGTYIRSLGRDLAESLGTAGVMSALRRTAIGSFRAEEAVLPERLHRDNWTNHLLPPLRAVEQLPRVELSAEEIMRLRNGLTISKETTAAAEIAAVDSAGCLVAIVGPAGSGTLRPLRNFPAA